MKLTGIALLASVLATTLTPIAEAVNLPPDFEMLRVGTGSAVFDKPVALAFAPDGRIFVSEQRGRIYILEPDGGAADPRTGYTKVSTPFLEIEDEVLFHWDRGLLGLALDPDFENNGWVYFAYMVETNGIVGGPPDLIHDSYTRVERVQASLADPNVADESTRQVLIGATWDTGVPSMHQSHTTGTLVFGDDGSLLISHGDGAHYDGVDAGGRDPESFLPGRVDPDEDVGAFRAHYLDSMAGKILRIDPNTGEGLPSNPWFESGDPGSDRSRLWAKGLRNPYRMDLKRGSGSSNPAEGNPGLLAISEVGWADFEELNLSRGGEDFGWPCYEGLEPQSDYQAQTPTHSGCDGDENSVTYGAITWPHGGGGSSPFGGLSGWAAVGSTFNSGTSWPAPYRDRLYFTDYIGKWIYAVALDENDQPIDMIEFATNTPTPVELRFDPFSEDLFSIDFNAGEVLRYVFVGGDGGGVPPTQPSGLVANPGNSEAFLSWDPNPEADVVGYHVYRGPSATGPWTQLTTQPIAGTNYNDIGIANNTEYFYYVVALDNEDPPLTSAPSEVASVIPLAKTWDWYLPHPGPTAEFLASPLPLPRRITVPNPNVAPNYDLWTTNNRAPQLRAPVDPVDDFTLETTIALQDFAPNENWHAGIVVRFADFDALLFGPYRGTNLRLERTGSGNLASLTNSSTTMDLRVVRSGQDYSFEFREDASQPWQVVTVYSASETPTHAGLVAKTWDPNVGLVMDVNRLGLNELPPVAVAGADELIGQAPHTVQFTSTSFDPDGPYLTHAWDFGGSGASTESDPSFEFATPGAYDVVLTVTDGAGYVDADTLSILVEGNLPPTAEITAPLDGLQFVNDGISPIALTGLGSDPDDVPDSLVLTWSVDLNDGGAVTSGYATPPAGASSSFVPDVVDAGQGVSWDVILTVTDTEGLAASDTVTIFDATLPPLALLDLRASLADSLGPPVVPGAQSPWVNLGGAGSAAAATLLNFGGATGWAGTGGVGDPWRLEFDGVDDVVTLPGGTLAGLDQGASIEMWVRFPADVQARSYLVEWLEDTAAPFPGMSLAVENGHLRIFLGTWVDLAPVQPNRWSRLLATKEPGAWLVELDGVVIGQGSTANLGAQVTELVLGAGTFAGAGVYAEHAGIAVSELRVWDFALSEVNRTVLGALDHGAWTNPPRLNLVTPSTVDNDSIQTLNLSGLDFVDGAMAQLIQSGIDTLEAESVVFMDAANLSAQFDFSNLTAGPRDVRVVNPDGQSSLLASAIQVNAPSPAIMAFLAALPDGASPPNVPSVDGPWLSTLGPDTLEFAGLEVSASGWRGDGSVEDPWQLALDGIDDLLTLRGPGIDSLDAASEFSAEFWLKVDGADSTGTLLAWREPLVELRLELTRDGLGLLDGGVFNLMSELPRDRWTYLVLTTSPDSTRLWIDGVETGGAPGAGFSLAPPIIEVGENLHSNFSSIRFSTVVLSANQIVSEYSSESGSYPSPEAARLRLVASAGHVADGDTITVDLDYDDLGYSFGLRGVSVSVLYDPALLDFVEASEGEFLGGAGTTFFTMDSSTPGIVAFDTSLLGQSEGAMGAGTLARLRFAEIVVETDTATTISVALQELIDADDPPNPIPTLKLPSIDLLIHGGIIVASPKVASLTRLYGAAPNPFNPRTTIAFDLASGGRTRLAIYDMAGRLVRVLADQPLVPGPHEFVWDGTDHGGRRVASGVYLYALRPEGSEPLVRKMTLVK